MELQIEAAERARTGATAAKEDWFARARIVDNQDVSLAADGAVTVRRQHFDKALRNFPKMDSPGKAKKDRKDEATDYDRCLSRKHPPPCSACLASLPVPWPPVFVLLTP